MKVSDLQLGDVVNIAVQPTSATSRTLRDSGATSVGTIIGIEAASTRLPILIGWTDNQVPLHVGAVGLPPGPGVVYIKDLKAYIHQLWIDAADVASKVSGAPTIMGATCSCGWENPYWDKVEKYVCQSCKMWGHVAG